MPKVIEVVSGASRFIASWQLLLLRYFPKSMLQTGLWFTSFNVSALIKERLPCNAGADEEKFVGGSCKPRNESLEGDDIVGGSGNDAIDGSSSPEAKTPRKPSRRTSDRAKKECMAVRVYLNGIQDQVRIILGSVRKHRACADWVFIDHLHIAYMIDGKGSACTLAHTHVVSEAHGSFIETQ